MANIHEGNRSQSANRQFDIHTEASKRVSRSGGSEVESVNARIMALIDQIIGEQQQMRALCKHLSALHEALRNVPPPKTQPVPNVPAVTAQAMISTTDADGNVTQSANPDYATQQAANTAAQAQASAVQAANAAEESRYWGQINALQSQIAGVEQELKECIERIDKLQSQIDRLRAVDLPAAERHDRERVEQQMGSSSSSGSTVTGDDISAAVDAAKGELRRAQSMLSDVRSGVMTALEPLAQTARSVSQTSGSNLAGSDVLSGLQHLISAAERLGAAESSPAAAPAVRRDGFAVPTRNLDTAVSNLVRGGKPPGGSGIGI